jgi:hypothetical protein
MCICKKHKIEGPGIRTMYPVARDNIPPRAEFSMPSRPPAKKLPRLINDLRFILILPRHELIGELQ